MACLHRQSPMAIRAGRPSVNIRDLATFAASSSFANDIFENISSPNGRGGLPPSPSLSTFGNGESTCSTSTMGHVPVAGADRWASYRPVCLFQGHSRDAIQTIQGSPSGDGRTNLVVAVVSQRTSFTYPEILVISCPGDLVANASHIENSLRQGLSEECLRNLYVIGLPEISLSNQGVVESPMDNGGRRLTETALGLGIANSLQVPYLGILDSDFSEEFRVYEKLHAKTVFSSPREGCTQHLRGYTVVSNTSFVLPDSLQNSQPRVQFPSDGDDLTLSSPSFHVSSSFASGPILDLRSEVWISSDSKPPSIMCKSRKRQLAGYLDGDTLPRKDCTDLSCCLALPPRVDLIALAGIHSPLGPLSPLGSNHHPRPIIQPGTNFAASIQECVSGLRDLYSECLGDVHGRVESNLANSQNYPCPPHNRNEQVTSNNLPRPSNIDFLPNEPGDPRFSDPVLLDSPPREDVDPRGSPRKPMSKEEVDSLFDRCPFKHNIPNHLVDTFKIKCLHDVRELWQQDELPPVLDTRCYIPVTKIVNSKPVPCSHP